MKSIISITAILVSITLFSSCVKDPIESRVGKEVSLSEETFTINPIGQNLTSSILISPTSFLQAEKERVLNEMSDNSNSTGTVQVESADIKELSLTDRSHLNPDNSIDMIDFIDHFDLILTDPSGVGPTKIIASSESFGEVTINERDLLQYSSTYLSGELRLITHFSSSLPEVSHIQVMCFARLQFIYSE